MTGLDANHNTVVEPNRVKSSTMAATADMMEQEEAMAAGPIPLSQLEVSHTFEVANGQGCSGLSAGDIKKFLEAGYHTVESVAYT